MRILLLLLFRFSVLPGILGGVVRAEAKEEPGWLVRSWLRPDGLPQNTVLAIEQTPDGYLWVGTRGGLARFDGVRFAVFGLADGLRSLDIVALEGDGDGGLWIGTFGGGLSHLQDGKITTLTMEDGLAHNNVMLLARGDDGALWVAGSAGVQRLRAGIFTTMGEAEGLPPGEVDDLVVGRDGEVWAALSRGGLFRFDGNRFESIAGPPQMERIIAFALLVDREGSLWVSIGNYRVLRLKGGEWTEFNEAHGLPLSYITCMAEGGGGEIWAGSQEEGLYVYRGERFERVKGRGDALEPAIRSLFRSRDGLMWTGTQAGGLSRISGLKLEYHAIGVGERRGQVHGIAEQPAGHFWVGTYGGGISHGALKDLVEITDTPVVNVNPYFLAALTRRAGEVVFGSNDAVVIHTPESGIWRAVPMEDLAITLYEGDDGILVIGFRNGSVVHLVDGESQELENGRFPGVIACIEGDGAAGLWIATKGAGLYHWDAGKVRSWGTGEGLPAMGVRALRRDAAGTLWIGTEGGGLAWMRGERLFSAGPAQGLGANVISQILEDDAGNLWLGSYRGILRVSKAELLELERGEAGSVHPLVLDEEDGIAVAECTGGFGPAGLRAESGKLLFSTVRGVVELDPTRFRTENPPVVMVEECAFDGRVLPVEAGVVTLPTRPGELEIAYTALNFAKPAQIRFRHRLEGLSQEWVETGGLRSARFSMLPPGNYTFAVAAANADGRWSEDEAKLAFTVPPLFWQAEWFRFLLVLLLMASGGSLVAWTARTRVRRAEALGRVARAEAEAQQQRNEVSHLTRLAMMGELSAALAHELNQPLTAILSNAQAARRFLDQDSLDEGEMREILDDIVADDQRASEVISRLRVLLKKGEFQPLALGVNEVAGDVLRLMRAELEARKVSVETDFPEGLPEARADRVQIQQVLINLILNACDAMAENAESGRSVTLKTCRTEEGLLEVSVIDCGPGIPPGGEERIFAPYHTTKAEGLGLGLALSRSIVSAHGGRLWAENGDDSGARFRFTLPLWDGSEGVS